MDFKVLTLGFIFGAILSYAELNKFNVITGLAVRRDLRVAKALLLAIGLGAILLSWEIAFGLASYHVKPFLMGGVVLGGLIFGVGMAILGYCPGTLAVSMGEGSLDAFFGILGGLTAGAIYTLLHPSLKPILGPNLGKLSLNTLLGTNVIFFTLVILLGIGFISLALYLHKLEGRKDYRWALAGTALALLNLYTFSIFGANRPIGASTAYPYLADLILKLTNSDYFKVIKVSGSWEVTFLLGALIAGFLFSLLRGELALKLIHGNWKRYRGTSALARISWAFIGGFLLIIGARMAGGCTSGHVLSGGMQLAFSSLTFALFLLLGFFITGAVFYKEKGIS